MSPRSGGRGAQKVRERPQKSQGNVRDSSQVECFYCQKKGHMKRNCRKRMQDEQMFKED